MPLTYHEGQIEVQTEANTRVVAGMLASWVGPVGEFCRTADMIVLAMPGPEGRLRFMALSGAAPVIEPAGRSAVLLRLNGDQAPELSEDVSCGGLAISLAVARRARLNGTLSRTADGLLLSATEAFTNCRKYVVPSVSLEECRHFGPTSRETIDVTDPWLAGVVATAETSFVASVSPDGVVDASHRGGPAGFFELDVAARRIEWDEYVGDGMLKSAGNVRATGRLTLVVPDLASGDAVELSGRAGIAMYRRDKRPRTEGLLQHKEEFPVQGRMTFDIESAHRLTGFMNPRRRIEKRQRVTSASSTDEQAPQ